MKRTIKTLDEFLELDYEFKVVSFEADGERGFVITCPDLDGIEVYGESVEEALEELHEAKIALFHLYEQLNIPIFY